MKLIIRHAEWAPLFHRLLAEDWHNGRIHFGGRFFKSGAELLQDQAALCRIGIGRQWLRFILRISRRRHFQMRSNDQAPGKSGKQYRGDEQPAFILFKHFYSSSTELNLKTKPNIQQDSFNILDESNRSKV
ncbi:MAG: hypothetical protein ALAOOOJD_01177 [bacterium]|nr:hypothetical protein [bacterium]